MQMQIQISHHASSAIEDIPGIEEAVDESCFEDSMNESIPTTPAVETPNIPHLEAPTTMSAYTLVDNVDAVKAFLDTVTSLPLGDKANPSLFVDLEGIHLCREGSISILQVHCSINGVTYLIDVHVLGKAAFETPRNDGTTLKELLENCTIGKAFFDCRNDSDALYAHYKVSLGGVVDIQLMELATRSFRKTYINGLAKCLGRDISLTAAEQTATARIKDKGLHLFAPERGGSYEAFNQRPLPDDLARYCVQDVALLPRLWTVYNAKLTPQWRMKVDDSTKDRVFESQSAGYVPNGRHKALGPWPEEQRDVWEDGGW